MSTCVSFGDDLVVNVLHERKNMRVVVFGLCFGLARGAALDTGALDMGVEVRAMVWFFNEKRFCACGRMMI